MWLDKIATLTEQYHLTRWAIGFVIAVIVWHGIYYTIGGQKRFKGR